MNAPGYRSAAEEKELRRNQISHLAYHLYLEDGCPYGSDLEHWFRAERLLKESLAVTEAIEVEEPQNFQPVDYETVTKSTSSEQHS